MTPHWAESVTAEDKRLFPAFAFVRLHQAVAHNLKRLDGNHDAGELDYVAWLTRNLLELRVWVAFCALSEKNAMDFYEDSARDLIDLNRKNDPSDTKFQEELANIAKALPQDKLPHKFTTASGAAVAVGIKEAFDITNKMLSKFVHPTAMSVFAPIRGGGAESIIQHFVAMGQEFGKECVDSLDASFMKPLYEKYEGAIIKVREEQPELDYVLTR